MFKLMGKKKIYWIFVISELLSFDLNVGNFACFFSQINIFQKIFREYHQSVKYFRSQIEPHIFSCLIWVQTVCKGYQQPEDKSGH